MSLYARSVFLLSLSSVCAADSPALLIEREEGVKQRKRGRDARKDESVGMEGEHGAGMRDTANRNTWSRKNQLKGWSENRVVARDGVMLQGKLEQTLRFKSAGRGDRWRDD